MKYNIWQKILKYGFVFSFSMFVLVFFSGINSYDSIWNYSFSYAIAKGQIPFLEINMITPGFYNFLMSLGLLISHNNIIFLMEQALLVTVTFAFLNKLFGDQAWLFLFFMSFSNFLAFCPTYNYLLLTLTILVIYLEVNKKSDYLIGVVLGLLILTKHTVGIILVIPSIIICFKDKKRLWQRFLGVFIPCSFYLIFLIVTGSFFKFLDLCFFGLLDFAGNNTDFVVSYFVLSLILLGISIFYVIKYPKDIVGYYVLAFFAVMIPIFTAYHFHVYLVMVSLLLMQRLFISRKGVVVLSLVLCFIVIGFNIFINYYGKSYTFLGYNNFNYLYLPKVSKEYFEDLNQLYHKYQKKGKVQILSSKNPWIKITNEEKLNNFTVFLNGNFGYHGTEKMIKQINKNGQFYYILDRVEYNWSQVKGQFPIDIVEYVVKHSQLVEEKEPYQVYYFRRG